MISFIVPAHNEEAWIGKCLASIRATMEKLATDRGTFSALDKTRQEYIGLAERFEKEGLFFLSGLAFEIAGDLSPKRP